MCGRTDTLERWQFCELQSYDWIYYFIVGTAGSSEQDGGCGCLEHFWCIGAGPTRAGMWAADHPATGRRGAWYRPCLRVPREQPRGDTILLASLLMFFCDVTALHSHSPTLPPPSPPPSPPPAQADAHTQGLKVGVVSRAALHVQCSLPWGSLHNQYRRKLSPVFGVIVKMRATTPSHLLTNYWSNT